MVRPASTVRAAVLTALAALLEVTLAQYLSIGNAGPRFMVIGVVFAAFGLRELQGVLIGFFGGILTDALSGGFFGVNSLSGVLAGFLAVRSGAGRRREGSRLTLVYTVMICTAAFDIIALTALNLSGYGSAPIGRFMIATLVPDVLLNGALAYLFGGVLTRFVSVKGSA